MVKKKTLVTLLIIIAILILPTGDPSDIISFAIIAHIGLPMFLVLAGIIIFLLHKTGVLKKIFKRLGF